MLIGAAKRDTSMWLIATYGAGPKNVIAIFDTARGANAGNAPCVAQMERRPKDWLQSLKADPPPLE
jgi:hypothetical protein